MILVATAPLVFGGCQRIALRPATTYTSLFDKTQRDFERAEAKHQLAIERICEGDTEAAEQLLRDALVCDASFGPAHNTLGKLYFDQRKFYLAAWEFEYALKAMPERTEPLNNLGLVFEAVGNFEKAIEYYGLAWAAEGDNADYLGNLIRARIRSGERSPDLHSMLQRLIEIDDRTEWVDWARGQLVLGKVGSPWHTLKSDDTAFPLVPSGTTPENRPGLIEELVPLEPSGGR